ncbi:MAG: sulfatase-like hydrolase/transferase [Verrucomicrobiota bacterium]
MKHLILYLAIIGLSVHSFAETKKPNIILVMSDDQGWGQVGYNNHPLLKTPHLDAMAEGGLRLNRFYAAGPVCSPTRASILTGRTHVRTGVPSHGNNLCLQEKTLPQALKLAGYQTAHFGKWHLNGVRGPGVPIPKDDPNHPGHYGFDFWLTVTNYFDLDPLMSRQGEFEAFKGDSSDIIVDEALKFIKAHLADPFFACIWYGSPHSPMLALDQDQVTKAKGKLAQHLGEIVAIDRSVGALRKGLREMGIEKRTIIWYCSDNGGLKLDPNSAGGLKGVKGKIYEGGIRVPAIIEWPGTIQPAISDFPASTMDMMPTFVDLLDLSEDSMLAVHDGESIKDLLFGKNPERDHAIPFYFQKSAAFIEGDYKLLTTDVSSGQWQLYDLKKDPAEEKNLASEWPERFTSMKDEALATLESIKNSALGKDYPEGKIIQKPRKDFWHELERYQAHFDAFKKLDPNFSIKETKKDRAKNSEKQ